MGRRHKKSHEEHLDESWLIPYCDLLTLLLALFIVLFAMSKIDAKKFEEMGFAFKKIIAKGSVESVSYAPQNGKPVEVIKTEEEMQKVPATLLAQENKRKLEEFKTQIDSYIKEQKLETKISTEYSGEGLLITIRDDILFQSGSADLTQDKREIAKALGNIFEKGGKSMEGIVSGHSDNVPINTPQYNSNWQLSTARAVNFMEAIIMENRSIDPGLFSARGFGEFKPLVANDSPENNQKNRRVEIMVRPVTQ
jgi:chemotaxis protein MotB